MVDTPTYSYPGGSQKVYRLVNVTTDGDVHAPDVTLSSLQQSGGQRRKRIALVPTTTLQTLQSVQLSNGINDQDPSVSGRSSMRNRIGAEEMVLDDGIQESTIVIDYTPTYNDPQDMIEIDQNGSPIPILEGDSPGISTMLIGGHQHMVSGSILRHRSPPPSHIDYEQNDAQYNDDIRFQALIASKLSELDEQNKTMMKFNIQRILFEARFGAGSSRLSRDEEQELSADTHVEATQSVSHELVTAKLE